MDVPTSWQALDNNALTHNDPIIKAVLDAINNMLIELMAAMARRTTRQGENASAKVLKQPKPPANTRASKPTKSDIKR